MVNVTHMYKLARVFDLQHSESIITYRYTQGWIHFICVPSCEAGPIDWKGISLGDPVLTSSSMEGT